MDRALFEKILFQIKRTPPPHDISLHLGGEPLLHPDFEYFVHLVNKYLGIRPTAATNGTLLFPERSRRIAEAGKVLFVITFAADKEIFEDNRMGARWLTVKENIEYALDMGIEIALHVLDSVKAVSEIFGERENLYIYPFTLHNVGGEFAETIEREYNYKIERRKYYPCTHPWFGMAIAWNGKVVLCCRDVLYSHIVGDLKKSPIGEVWNGRELIRVRRLMKLGKIDKIPLCRTCSRPWEDRNRPINLLKRYLF